MTKDIDNIASTVVTWCKDTARRSTEKMKRDLDHLITMEAGRVVEHTLAPVKIMLRSVYDVNDPSRRSYWNDEKEKKVAKRSFFNPGKVAIANKLIDPEKLNAMDEWDRNIEMSRIAATLFNKGAFNDSTISQVQSFYEKNRKENWDDELKRDRLQPEFPKIDEGSVFASCRADGTSRKTCAAGMDEAEKECKEIFDSIKKIDLPINPPGSPVFIEEVAKRYPPESKRR